MAITHGMNVEQIRGIGKQLKSVASNDIANLINQVNKLVTTATANWSGNDSTQFSTEWNTVHRKALANLQTSLTTYGDKALKNATKQEEASKQY